METGKREALAELRSQLEQSSAEQGRLAARVMRRGIDGLESAVRGNAGHASKRCREGPTRRRNAEHRAKRVREYDAMQASPAIVVLICRTEEGGRSEQVEACA